MQKLLQASECCRPERQAAMGRVELIPACGSCQRGVSRPLLVLVLAALSCTFLLTSCSSGPDQASLQATATTRARATANTQATATAVTQTFPFSTHQVLKDSLSQSDGSWAQGSGCGFTSGSYTLELDQKDYILMCPNNKSYDNFSFELTIKDMQGGSNSEAGILFGYTSLFKIGYAFLVRKDGKYTLLNCTGTELVLGISGCFELQQGRLPGKMTFPVHLGVSIHGTPGVLGDNMAIFYVNRQQVAKYSDPHVSSAFSGSIGAAIHNKSGTTMANFINANVWTYSS